jgi:hypothetical protein
MNVTRTISFLLVLLFLSAVAQGQEKRKGEGEERRGILERIGDEIEKKDDDDDSSEGDRHGWVAFFWGVIDPVDLVEALAHMRPGPFPYNSDSASFVQSKKYPGGVVQLQGGYFQHSSARGFLWRYRYLEKRFSFVSEFDVLEEDLGRRIDRQSWATARLGWDFLSLPQFRGTGEIGFRSMLEDHFSTMGPEVGLRFMGLPGQPLIVEGQSTLARLNGTWLSTHSFNLGVIVWRFEVLFGGYIYRTPSTVLDGWQVGFRTWL